MFHLHQHETRWATRVLQRSELTIGLQEYDRAAWEELIERCEATGVDAFEINFSCPHGMPERKMGMAMGQDCDLLEARTLAR